MATTSKATDKTSAPKKSSDRKTECPVTKKQFADKAPNLKISIHGKEFFSPPKAFSTGSVGWMLNDKFQVEVDGKLCTVQIGLNMIVVGSKEAKDE